MKRNEGSLDRGLRIVAGLILIGLAANGTIGAWGWIGVVPLATGLMGWCPVYTLLGFSSCPRPRHQLRSRHRHSSMPSLPEL